jgi:hypothetical protein
MAGPDGPQDPFGGLNSLGVFRLRLPYGDEFDLCGLAVNLHAR